MSHVSKFEVTPNKFHELKEWQQKSIYLTVNARVHHYLTDGYGISLTVRKVSIETKVSPRVISECYKKDVEIGKLIKAKRNRKGF